METNPTLEFEHYLAQKLGMTVGAMRAQMGAAEFVDWQIYYGRLAQQRELEQGGGRGRSHQD